MTLKIGLKYCGGCNPGYDRVATVEKVARTLQDLATFVPPGHDDYDAVLAVQGCCTACADLTAFENSPVWTITSGKEGDRFCRALLEHNVRIDHFFASLMSQSRVF